MNYTQDMEITKAQWTADGNNVRLSMPLSKVDKENRIVSGFASLDNTDTQGDRVTSDASKRAFERFRGNIREMHQPIAVGRMVSFKEDSFYDKDTQKFYNGVWVDVRVSKGAQDTWEKVLDGTLQGFSIGGSIIDAETVFDKSADGPVRIVKDYDLVELSLVDSPANPKANIVSVMKMAGDNEVSGMIAEVSSENVFYCKTDEIAKTSTDDSVMCPNGHKMDNIGWFEYENDMSKAAKVKDIVIKYTTPENTQEVPATNEGGVDVAEETVTPEAGSTVPAEVGVGEQGKATNEVAASVDEKAVEVQEVAGAEASEESTEVNDEKAADVSEVEDAEDNLVKSIDGLKNLISEGLEKNATSVAGALENLNGQMEKFTTTLENKLSELGAKHGELTEKFAELNGKVDGFEKSISTLEDESAIKKSGSLGGEAEASTLKKSASDGDWNGHFLSVDSI